MTAEPAASPRHPLPPEYFTEPPADPHEQNAALRSACPVHAIDYPPGGEAYMVTDYATSSEAFSDPRLSKDPANAPAWFREALEHSSPVLIHHMLSADPPRHTRLRKLVGRAFLPRQIEKSRPRVQEITDDLVDGFPGSGEIDLMDFALALPMQVICELLGVPIDIRPRLHEWGVTISGAPYPDEESNERLRIASESIEQFFLDLLKARRAEPGTDLTSDILRAAADGYTDDEVVSTLVLLIIAGHRTTANLIGNGIRALLLHPDQLERLRSDPALAASAVEEFLRYEAPTNAMGRIVRRTHEVRGVTLKEGDRLFAIINAANRDETQFPDADKVDVGRQPNRHLTFGQGAHFCLGAQLARLEARLALPALIERLPGMSPGSSPPVWLDSLVMRGLKSLPVRTGR